MNSDVDMIWIEATRSFTKDWFDKQFIAVSEDSINETFAMLMLQGVQMAVLAPEWAKAWDMKMRASRAEINDLVDEVLHLVINRLPVTQMDDGEMDGRQSEP